MKKLISIVLALSFLMCAFSGCEKNEEQSAGSNTQAIQDIPENAASDFAYKETEKGIKIIGYKGTSTSVKIPSEINGKPVLTIAEYAFDGFEKTEEGSYQTHKENNITRIVSLYIPGTVRALGEGAFANCYSLTEVVISEGVETMGEGAFANCNELTSISLPESLTTIGGFAFNCCSKLQEISLGKNVSSVGEYAFYECTSLEKAALPDSLETLGRGAFFSCTALKELMIPESAKTIEEYAFGYTIPKDEHGHALSEEFELIPDVTVISGAGSEAENYANSNNIKFKSK